MDNNIYEVTRDEYVGFLGQIKPEALRTEVKTNKIMVYSITTGILLAERMISQDENQEYYYIFNMPLDSERKEPPRICKINLETREEVQTFFQILNELGKKNDGRDIQ